MLQKLIPNQHTINSKQFLKKIPEWHDIRRQHLEHVYKVWTQQENYYSYTASRMTDRTPMFVLGIRYSFKNKVTQKWRQKKQFYGRDNTLQGITVQ